MASSPKITKVSVFQVDLPLKEGSYNWSEGKSVQVFDATVVRITTNLGVTGFGECCPLGPTYLPSYAEGCRAGLKVLAPSLIGENPLELLKLNEHMDRCLKGHPYIKSPVDVACWGHSGQGHGTSRCHASRRPVWRVLQALPGHFPGNPC